MLLATLRADLHATRKYTGGVSRALYPSFFSVALYRLAQSLRRRRVTKPLAWLTYYVNLFITGAELPGSAEFGPGLYLVHPNGTILSPGARGGKSVTMFGGVVIGSATNGNGVEARPGDPVIGDDVVILAKATIAGPISVGDGCTVGAHAVVLKDVPARSVVAGIPARVLRTY